MRGGEIPGLGPILSRFCRDPGLSRDNSPNSGSYGPPGDHKHHITNVDTMIVVNDVQTGAAVWFFVIWDRVGSRGSRSRPDGQWALGGVMRGWRWIHTPSSCQRWCHRQQVVEAPYSLGILCQAQVWWRTQRMPSRLLRMLA